MSAILHLCFNIFSFFPHFFFLSFRCYYCVSSSSSLYFDRRRRRSAANGRRSLPSIYMVEHTNSKLSASLLWLQNTYLEFYTVSPLTPIKLTSLCFFIFIFIFYMHKQNIIFFFLSFFFCTFNFYFYYFLFLSIIIVSIIVS